MVRRVVLASLLFTLFVTISASGQTSPGTARQLSLGKLYGTTSQGGFFGTGTVFVLKP